MAETHAPTETPTQGQEFVKLTPNAQKQALVFLAEEDDPSSKVLRIGVKSGGCSGFSYSISIDVPKEKDHRYVYPGGLTVVTDPVSLTFLNGTVVDYQDTVDHAGFSFENPQASQSCGCGTSFSV
ncbi:MAG: iron-sulfur cluster assembly accessory protein [Planctomycetota bacterium]